MTAPRSTADAMGTDHEVDDLRARVERLSCPACNISTTPYQGHRTLCFHCSLEAENTTWDELKDRTRAQERRAAKRMAGGRDDAAVMR